MTRRLEEAPHALPTAADWVDLNVKGEADVGNDPTRSSYDGSYWLRLCEGWA